MKYELKKQHRRIETQYCDIDRAIEMLRADAAEVPDQILQADLYGVIKNLEGALALQDQWLQRYERQFEINVNTAADYEAATHGV